MKNSLLAALTLFGWMTFASPLIVRDADIHGKTDLTTTAVALVNGVQKTVLVDNAGMSLYTFDDDAKDVSNCSGGCLSIWPPQHVLSTSKVEAPYGTIQGNDGQTQLTLDGRPLYHYNRDKKAGDTFGNYPKWSSVEVVN